MRVKEWHRIMVRGLPVFHVLEPAYYRPGKTNIRMVGIWYCAECDDIIDMRLLSKQGFVRKTHLSGRYTSMFERGLRFERKPSLSDQVVDEIDDLEEDHSQRKEQTKTIARAMPQVIGKRNKREAIEKATNEVDKLKEFLENRYKGLPNNDRKGNEISENEWDFAINHGNYPCPCGSGKKYKRCHGA